MTRTSKRVTSSADNDVHIPRPPNAWVLFRAFWVNKVKESNKELKLVYKAEQTTLSTLLSIEWAALPDDERQKWFRMAYEKKLEHKRLYPNYRYQPQKKVTSVRKNAVAKKASKSKKMPIVGRAPQALQYQYQNRALFTSAGADATGLGPATSQYNQAPPSDHWEVPGQSSATIAATNVMTTPTHWPFEYSAPSPSQSPPVLAQPFISAETSATQLLQSVEWNEMVQNMSSTSGTATNDSASNTVYQDLHGAGGYPFNWGLNNAPDDEYSSYNYIEPLALYQSYSHGPVSQTSVTYPQASSSSQPWEDAYAYAYGYSGSPSSSI